MGKTNGSNLFVLVSTWVRLAKCLDHREPTKQEGFTMPSTEPTWVRKFFERKAISSLSRKFFTKHCDCIQWSFTLTRSWALTGIWFCVGWSMEKWGDFASGSLALTRCEPMLTTIGQARGTSIRAVSKAFLFKRTNIFSWFAGTSNAMLCGRGSFLTQKIGVGVHCGDGCKDRCLNPSCFPRGRSHVCQTGFSESMNLSVTANSKQFATAPSVEHHWGMKAGSNPLHEDWILNRQCDRVDDRECDRYHPMTKTKRFDPFVFS